MLARSFLSPEVLGITAKQHAALVKVLHMMERGELHHAGFDGGSVHGGAFNMQWWELPASRYVGRLPVDPECGTICCIGGWAEKVGGSEMFSFYKWAFRDRKIDPKKKHLCDLFYPPDTDLSRVTVDQASRALSSYLTTGDPKWGEILCKTK
jgi:hypothetical protein